MFPIIALIVLFLAGNAFVAWCCLKVGADAERAAEQIIYTQYEGSTK